MTFRPIWRVCRQLLPDGKVCGRKYAYVNARDLDGCPDCVYRLGL